jgi:cytochrome c553
MVRQAAWSLLLLITAFCFSARSNNHEQQYPVSQGWTQGQMKFWYEASQGSRLVPLTWLEALQNADGTTFFTRAALEKWGYDYFSDAPGAWPIGFVKDEQGEKSWLGFNCSACHTAKLKANGHEVLIHGGQSMADFQALTTALIAAVERTQKDAQSFQQFATTVLGVSASAEAKADLNNQMSAWLKKRATINNTGANSHWGRGRADAVGVILATTAYVVADPDQPIDPLEFPESDAPVSYPFIWNANQQGVLQHNGVVDNGVNLGPIKVAKIGALIRNWTEALGVFADVELNADQSVTTSIKIGNLLKFEQALAKLQSPVWPVEFGVLDDQKRQRGANHFAQNCASCHGALDATDVKTDLPLIKKPVQDLQTESDKFVLLQPVMDDAIRPRAFFATHQPRKDLIGTDPSMACNAVMHRVPTGRLKGEKNVKGFIPLPGHPAFGDRAVTTDLLRVLIQRDITSNATLSILELSKNQLAGLRDLIKSAFYAVVQQVIYPSAQRDKLKDLRDQLERCAAFIEVSRAMDPESALPVYKARPLNGIWATAPYLHNGSVPTLFDLLQPQAKRPEKFGYVDGQMDLVKAGLKNQSDHPDAFQFKVFDELFMVRGNWNGGHEYGTSLSEEEKMDLIEYLKGL